MEKIISFLFFTNFLYSVSILAQTPSKITLNRKHLISADVTFTPGWMFQESKAMYYFHGALSYYPTPRISVRGDGALSLREYVGDEVAMRYHTTFFGICYHFTENGPFDLFVGIQPGFSLFERSFFNNAPIQRNLEIIPNASIVFGAKYFVNRFFNFFTNVRYVYGQPAVNPSMGNGLHEVRLAFGLGLNFAQKQ